MTKAFIFDMDDVVLDSSMAHTTAWDKVLSEYGVTMKMMGTEAITKIFGLRIREITERIIKQFNLDVSAEELNEKREKIFNHIIEREMSPSRGLIPLLELLTSKGLKIGLATSGVKEYADMVLDKLKIRHFFKAIVTGDDVTNSKPNPEPFLKTAGKLGVDPKECVVIEDAEKGVQAAHAAGMKAIGYQNMSHPFVQNLTKADLVVKGLFEITEEVIDKL